MRINERTRISELIKASPRVIEALAEFNPHFNKLKNPVLRNLLAKRVSISDACRIAGCEPSDFLSRMAEIGFETEEASISLEDTDPRHGEVPAFIADMTIVELDVRPALAKGEDPLKRVLETAKDLKKEECLKIINTFEPTPLISLLAKRGYESWTEQLAEDVYITWFVRGEATHESDLFGGGEAVLETRDEFEQMVQSFGVGKLHKIDVRDLPMPFPMRRIMEYLPNIKEDEALFVYHKKVPVYLLPELTELGFRYFIQTLADGQVNMLICKT